MSTRPDGHSFNHICQIQPWVALQILVASYPRHSITSLGPCNPDEHCHEYMVHNMSSCSLCPFIKCNLFDMCFLLTRILIRALFNSPTAKIIQPITRTTLLKSPILSCAVILTQPEWLRVVLSFKYNHTNQKISWLNDKLQKVWPWVTPFFVISLEGMAAWLPSAWLPLSSPTLLLDVSLENSALCRLMVVRPQHQNWCV